MLKTISKLVSLALAALIAVPAMAGDFGGQSFSRHGGIGHHQSQVFGRHAGWNGHRARLADGYGGFGHHRWRTPLLKRVNTASNRYSNRNVVVVVQPQQQDGWTGGTYAGSSYAYAANGGTYVGGSGYYVAPQQQPDNLAPMAKVIDVTAKSSACSYEAGVCVIRP